MKQQLDSLTNTDKIVSAGLLAVAIEAHSQGDLAEWAFNWGTRWVLAEERAHDLGEQDRRKLAAWDAFREALETAQDPDEWFAKVRELVAWTEGKEQP